jgi:broad specificity phosphatase PhoE
VFSSDLPRAHNTARIIISKGSQGVAVSEESIKTTHLLRELSFGVRESLPRGTTVAEAKAVVAERQGIPVDQVKDTAESKHEAKLRQHQFLLHLREYAAEITAEPATILCVSHGAFIKEFITNFCPFLPPVSKIGNCSVSVIKIAWHGPGAALPVTASEGDGAIIPIIQKSKLAADVVHVHCTADPAQTNMCLE